MYSSRGVTSGTLCDPQPRIQLVLRGRRFESSMAVMRAQSLALRYFFQLPLVTPDAASCASAAMAQCRQAMPHSSDDDNNSALYVEHVAKWLSDVCTRVNHDQEAKVDTEECQTSAKALFLQHHIHTVMPRLRVAMQQALAQHGGVCNVCAARAQRARVHDITNKEEEKGWAQPNDAAKRVCDGHRDEMHRVEQSVATRIQSAHDTQSTTDMHKDKPETCISKSDHTQGHRIGCKDYYDSYSSNNRNDESNKHTTSTMCNSVAAVVGNSDFSSSATHAASLCTATLPPAPHPVQIEFIPDEQQWRFSFAHRATENDSDETGEDAGILEPDYMGALLVFMRRATAYACEGGSLFNVRHCSCAEVS